MKKYLVTLILFSIFSIRLLAQYETPPIQKRFLSPEWTFSVFNNAIALPFSGRLGIVHNPLHPGAAVSKTHYWNTNRTHQLYQTFTAGLFYQQHVQTGVQLYSAFNYRFLTSFKLGLEAHVGVGYLHAFRDLQQFKLNDAQQYEKMANLGRPSLMVPLGVSFSYPFNDTWRPFIGYQIWFQTPFAKEYISILPNTSLHIGTALFLKK